MRKLSVNTGMSRQLKPTPQAKRVAPPAVPDVYRHSGSSFGSAGYASSSSEEAGYLAPPDTPSALSIRDDHSDYGSAVSKSPGVLGPYTVTPTAFQFPGPREQPLTHKAAVYYHQQLALQEDQGIDLTQSPGRDSPGSSSGSAGSGSRHSTASLDSGRASSYLTGTSTRGALSSPRCSVSSCSIGSVDRMNQRTEHEVIHDWLNELHFEEYTELFTAAGYDLPTIARMTPEDLTAIGIKKPNHRERIKQHIDTLQLPDTLPNYVPGSIEEWLRLLRLEEYIQPLLAQGYPTVRDVVTQLAWEDLEDIGIVKLGHQKKILLAIKRVKDILNGKWLQPGLIMQQQQQQQTWYMLDNNHYNYNYNNENNYMNKVRNLRRNISTNATTAQQPFTMYNEMTQQMNNGDIVTIKLRQPRGKSLESLEDLSERSGLIGGNCSTHLTFCRPNDLNGQNGSGVNGPPTAVYYCNQHNNGTASGTSATATTSTPSSISATTNGCYHPQNHQMLQQQHSHHHHSSGILGQYTSAGCMQTMPWRRSYDDGDITPTNEFTMSQCDHQQQQGGGTLPRQRHSQQSANVQRCLRPIQTKLTMQQQLIDNYALACVNCPDKGSISCYAAIQHCSPLMGKKQPPEPPRRQCSQNSSSSLSSSTSSVVVDQMVVSTHFEALTLSFHRQLTNSNNTNNTNLQNFTQSPMVPGHLIYNSTSQQQQILPLQQSINTSQHIHIHHQQNGGNVVLVPPQPLYVNYTGNNGNCNNGSILLVGNNCKTTTTIHQTTIAEIHAEKSNESKSNSSIDSIDTIPFANENAGTIKQRAMNRHDLTSSLSSSSSSSSSSATTIANIATCSSSSSGGNTCLPLPLSLKSSASHLDGTQSATPSPTLSSSSSSNGCGPSGSTLTIDTVTCTNNQNAGNGVDTNVLNDIGNMLANLTDELDAMLEAEKRAGLNDSE